MLRLNSSIELKGVSLMTKYILLRVYFSNYLRECINVWVHMIIWCQKRCQNNDYLYKSLIQCISPSSLNKPAISNISLRHTSINAQCRSKSWHWSEMPLNADQFLSMPRGINRNWSLLIKIDRHWDQCQNFDWHWSELVIDQGSPVA